MIKMIRQVTKEELKQMEKKTIKVDGQEMTYLRPENPNRLGNLIGWAIVMAIWAFALWGFIG